MLKDLKGLSKYCQFSYIYHFRHGYFKELEMIMDPSTLDEFLTCGFIKTGYSEKGKTWGITFFGIEFFEDFYGTPENKK